MLDCRHNSLKDFNAVSEPGPSGSGGAVEKRCQYYDLLQILLSKLGKRGTKDYEEDESDTNPYTSTSTTSNKLSSSPTETPKNRKE